MRKVPFSLLQHNRAKARTYFCAAFLHLKMEAIDENKESGRYRSRSCLSEEHLLDVGNFDDRGRISEFERGIIGEYVGAVFEELFDGFTIDGT